MFDDPMKPEPTEFERSLERRTEAMAEACTACGACAEVCPTPGLVGIEAASEVLTAGVVDILKGGAGNADAERWARACCGSGHCLSVCEHGINPRFMLMMARDRLNAKLPAEARKTAGKRDFQAMSRAARVISRLQLPADLMARLSPASHPESAPDLIFYTGCNMPKTPHIGLLCLDVLDRLGASYQVHGGPANCCGILQMRQGDMANGGRQLNKTIERYAATGAAEVVSWCPTCHMQFDEAAETDAFDTAMFPVYLARRLDALKPLFTERQEKRVALLEFPGSPGVTESVVELLSAIPGVKVVDLDLPADLPRAGYQMSGLSTVPDYRSRLLTETLGAAERAGLDMLLSIYHADHRELVSHQDHWPFEIGNYMELIGAAMGIRHDDLFKRLKLMQDADRVLASVADQVAGHGLDAEEVRDLIVSDLLGEQHLSPDRTRHPSPHPSEP